MSDEKEPVVRAYKWRVEYPGGKFVQFFEHPEPVGEDAVRAEIESWHISKQVPKGTKFIPQDEGKSPRFILKLCIMKVDDDGTEVKQDAFISLLTATSDFESLEGLMYELYQDATEQVEQYENSTLSDLYPSDSPRFPEEEDED